MQTCNAWIAIWLIGLAVEITDGWMDRWLDGWINEWLTLAGWMDGMNGWRNGWVYALNGRIWSEGWIDLSHHSSSKSQTRLARWNMWTMLVAACGMLVVLALGGIP